MCKQEKIKIMLDFYKSIILALLTALFGVLGYTFINYKNYSYIDIFIVIISISILFISLMIFAIIFLKEAKRLGDWIMNAGIIALIVSFLGFFGALLFITYKFYKFTNENTK